MKKNKGFTLMELIVVLAILAIIAAILIPLFMNTTDRARLRADIQSARVINNALELYRLERGNIPPEWGNAGAIIDGLTNSGYLPENVTPQLSGATWDLRDQRIAVNITEVTSSGSLYDNLSEAEREFVIGP